MNIGINAQLLAFTENYRQAGLSRHIYELLARVPGERPGDTFTAFVPGGNIPRDFTSRLPDNLKLAQSHLPTGRAPVRIAWEQLALPFASASARLHLLHCPVNVRPLVSLCPVIITIHDLIFLRYPESFQRGKRLYLSTMTRWSARHAAHVIAVSDATRRDAVEMLGVPPHRVTTVYNGVSASFKPLPPDEIARFRDTKGLSQRTILYIGTLEPRKNVSLLLRAFKELVSSPAFNDAKLIIGGSKGWYYNEIFSTVQQLGLAAGDRVRFLGRVPDEELPLWYNVAALFVYPSRYEGFGLPPLEAMACGAPVVVSNTSSLPEVVGDAGILLDPDDHAAWAIALRDLLTDGQHRSELRAKGLRQAQKFTWQRAAAETAEIYGRVLARGRRQRARPTR